MLLRNSAGRRWPAPDIFDAGELLEQHLHRSHSSAEVLLWFTRWLADYERRVERQVGITHRAVDPSAPCRLAPERPRAMHASWDALATRWDRHLSPTPAAA